jgi:DNA segregation ATPase FtsK/SpoIIIE, S-DNA-T family
MNLDGSLSWPALIEVLIITGSATAVTVLVALGKWWRRRLLLAAIVVWLVAVHFGSLIATAVVAAALVGLVAWRLIWPGSFEHIAVRYVRFGRRRTWYRDHWQDLMVGHGLSRDQGRGDKRVTVVPWLNPRIRCGPWLDRLWARPLVGQSVEDWATQTDALAMAMGALGCRIAVQRPGVLRLEVLWADPLAAVVPALSIPAAVDLAGVPAGVAEDGTAWTVQLTENHLLVAGVTGSGKSSVVWSILRGIAPAVHAGLVQLWGVDPKGGMELAPGRALFARFAGGDLDEMVNLFEDAVAAMRDRAARYAGARRRHEPTAEDPLLVVAVDEIAFLTAYIGDNKLRNRVNQAVATLLTQGRAVGVCVVAALQDPRKEVIGYRNLFPTKIALRLDERTQVDMVLGDGAREAGARCDQIPDTSPGVAYVKVDGVREPRRVRAGFVTDADITAMAEAYPAPVADEREEGAAA